MRTGVLDSLFTRTRQEILGTLFVSPEGRWYVSDLARHIGVPPSTLQRDLASLSESGILIREPDGRRVYYRVNKTNPLFPDLQSIFIKTVGLADVIREALSPFFDRVVIAFIFGSFARQEHHGGSDIDLIVVGSAGLAELALPLRIAEEKLHAAIDVVHYSVSEFQDKVRDHNHFLETVLSERKIYLKGSDDDLAVIINQRQG